MYTWLSGGMSEEDICIHLGNEKSSIMSEVNEGGSV